MRSWKSHHPCHAVRGAAPIGESLEGLVSRIAHTTWFRSTRPPLAQAFGFFENAPPGPSSLTGLNPAFSTASQSALGETDLSFCGTT